MSGALKQIIREYEAEKPQRDLADKLYGCVECDGFDTIGPPCASCPNDASCPILRPSTRLRIGAERV